ncbi:MAG: FAD-dependent thymidylate synthase [Ardenticatenaceae bacterium]
MTAFDSAFHSAAPQVTLVNAFDRPYENAVATARTCYSSKGIVSAEQVGRKPGLRDRIAESIYQAGHHTTFQHAHVQFGLTNVSRQFIWSFLHSHPFYNSEQVSQRYVKTDTSGVLIPQLEGQALAIYVEAVEKQAQAYNEINEMLLPTVEGFYYGIFPSRAPKAWRGAQHTGRRIAKRTIPKKAQEVGRYVLPVGTFAYLYHTVSALTLLRYYRLCQQFDVPTETHYVVNQMVRLLLEYDPLFATILEEPIPLEETIEYRYFAETQSKRSASRAFVEEFDATLEGYTSKLISYKPDNEQLLAGAVREVLGLARSEMSDAQAIGLVLDPGQNPYFGESMNITTLSKLTRTMVHPHYTFRKKLSHTADSQDQRHRMTPASRPTLRAYLSDEPDYITPGLLWHNDAARQRYDDAMNDIWGAIRKLRALGVEDQKVVYLLPNAVAIRFTESGDLLSMHHKLRMRLCYNAQEEIFAASKDEALQIQQANPQIGSYLGAPCTLRHAASTRPYCPEGDRYCGVPVWKIQIKDYKRVL